MRFSWSRLALLCALLLLNRFTFGQVPYSLHFTPTRETPQAVQYDPVHGRFFVTVPGENAIYVTAEADGSLIGKISVPSAFELALSADSSRLYVTSSVTILGYGAAEGFYVVDTATLRVIDFVQPTLVNSRVQTYVYASPAHVSPRFIAPLANGKIAYVASQRNSTGGTLCLYDPATGMATPIPSDFYDGTVVAAQNGSAFVAIAGDSAGEEVLTYDTASGSFVGNQRFTFTNNNDGILSPDGSRVLIAGRYLYTPSLARVADLASSAGAQYAGSRYYLGSTFSPDGSRIYVVSQVAADLTGTGGTSYDANSAIAIFDTASQKLLGYVPVPSGSAGSPAYGAIAASNSGKLVLAAASATGFVELDASKPVSNLSGTVSQSISSLSSSTTSYLLTDTGVPTAPAPAFINGSGFRSGAQAYFGNIAVPTTLVSSSQLSVQPPPGAPGPVDVTVSFPDGWATLGPQLYSYGPVITGMSINAGDAAGGTVVTLGGIGLATSGVDPQITVGGRSASVIAHSNVDFFENVTFSTPAGTPGSADLTFKNSFGETTLPGAFRYLASQSVSSARPLAMVMDEARNQLYVADGSSGSVLALDRSSFATRTLFTPASGPASGLALTPDGTRLLVLSYTGFTLDVVDLSSGKSLNTITPSLGAVPGRYAPFAVAATSRGTALVSVYDTVTYLQGATYEVDLGSGITFPLRGDSGLSANILAGTPDGASVFYTIDGSLGTSGGRLFLWSAPMDAVTLCCGFGGQSELATDDLGDRLLADSYTFDNQLRDVTTPAIDTRFTIGRSPVYGEKVHSSGSLIYRPTTRGVEISDARHGNLFLSVGDPAGALASTQNLAVSHDGSQLFFAEKTGLRLFTLNPVPLSVGSLTPSAGSAAGGVSVLVRGSGFVNGAKVTLDGQPAAVQFLDSTRLQITTPAMTPAKVNITVSDPDGTSYSFDAAYDATSSPPQPSPVLTAVSPVQADSGQDFVATITGSGFTPGSVVLLDGTPALTTFDSSTTIQAKLLNLAGPQTAILTATNPGSSPSNGLTLPVVNSYAFIQSISPQTITAGSGPFSLQVLGFNIAPSSTVYWNGSPRPTLVLSSGELLASISASDVASAGTATVTFVTPQALYGQNTSSPLSFTITPAVAALSLGSSPISLGPVFAGGSVTAPLKLTSSGQLPLTLTAIAVSNPDFAVTHTCTAALNSGQTCSETITFTPSVNAGYSEQATVTISSNASVPAVVNLVGLSGNLSVSASAISVKQGSSATGTVQIITNGNTPGLQIALACSGLPVGASCTFDPSTLGLGAATSGSSQTGSSTVTITTSAPTQAVLRSTRKYDAILAASLLGTFAFVFSRRRSPVLLLFLLLLASSGLCACAGSSGSTSQTTPPNPGTPLGTSTVIVTGTTANMAFKTTFSLTVN